MEISEAVNSVNSSFCDYRGVDYEEYPDAKWSRPSRRTSSLSFERVRCSSPRPLCQRFELSLSARRAYLVMGRFFFWCC